MTRIVWIIGAGSGIGAATARRLAAAGDTVVLSSRDGARLTALADQLTRAGGTAGIEPLDVTDAQAVAGAAGRIASRYGRLDAVVLSAQTMAYGRVEDVPAAVFDRVVDTATHGTANVARTVLPLFRKAGAGTLVVVNSLVGEIAVPGLSTYACAKWAQLGLVRSLQLETRGDARLHVCIVSPGAIDTPIYRQAANFSGRVVHPPPPVLPADRAARVVQSCLRRPRAHVEVGPANTLTVLGFRLLPFVYDRIVRPLARLIIFRGGTAARSEGNVITPRPQLEQEDGGWTWMGTRRGAT